MPCLLTHQPIDLVIVMLATNDLKGRFGVGARDIAAGAGLLLDVVHASMCGPGESPPEALLLLDAQNHEQLGVVVAQQVRLLLA